MLKQVFLSFEESMKKMKEENVQRIIVTYKVSYNQATIIRGVLSLENEVFTGLMAISNHPRLASTRSLSWEQGLNIIKNLYDGVYTLQTLFLQTGVVENVRGEVVLG